MIYSRQSKKHGVAYQVKRLEGKLNATFHNHEAALLQDALWARWGRAFPVVLADQKPNVPQALLSAVLNGSDAKQLSPTLRAQFLAAHPAREEAIVVGDDKLLLGEYIDEFIKLWKNGKVPGNEHPPISTKSAEEMEERLNRLILKVRYIRNARGHRIKDANGSYLVEPEKWAADALAWIPIDEVLPRDLLTLHKKLMEEKVGLEVWRKVLGFLQQLFDYALIEGVVDVNPVRSIKKPPQSKATARSAMMPDTLEAIRADFLYLDTLTRTRIRGEKVAASPAGVPVPEIPGYALFSADFVEAIGYSGCRPGEIFALLAEDLVQDKDGRLRLVVSRRCVDGKIIGGTKSKNFPTKSVYLLGPLSETLTRLAEEAVQTESRLLFPFPGTDRPWTYEDYKRWRTRFFGPIAKAHGLAEDCDDPYSLRHTYSSLRVAAHHPTEHIEQSMGTSLVSKVYTTVLHEYEGKEPLDIDETIRKERKAALRARGLTQ